MRKTIDITKSPSQEQIEMLTKAAKLPIHEEAESPEFSEIELMFKRIAGEGTYFVAHKALSIFSKARCPQNNAFTLRPFLKADLISSKLS